MQDRIGPNRARIALPGLKNRSLAGLPYVAADSLKMLFKEDLNSWRIAGIAFICIGTVLIAQSGHFDALLSLNTSHRPASRNACRVVTGLLVTSASPTRTTSAPAAR